MDIFPAGFFNEAQFSRASGELKTVSQINPDSGAHRDRLSFQELRAKPSSLIQSLAFKMIGQ